MKNLQNRFLDELAEIYNAEVRLTRALPKMAKAAGLLQEILNEEIAADEKLTQVARRRSNEAAQEGDSGGTSGSGNDSGFSGRETRPVRARIKA